jgi:Inosine-uridine preferring nucleoside hydrolase
LKYFSDGLSEITESHPELNLPPDLLSTGNHPQLEQSDRPGHQAALDLLREHPPHTVTYIVLGPLTNLAYMLRTDGACVRERVGRVVIMGGALDVPGNASPSAECASPFPSHVSVDPLMLYCFAPSQFLRRPIRRR